MKPRKYNNPPPARTVVPPVGNSSAHPAVLTPADEVIVLVGERMPRRWLHVALLFPAGTEPAAAASAAAWFTTRIRVIDKRLRLTLDRQRCVATGSELVLAFAPQHGGALADEWLEAVKPVVRDLCAAEFKEAEVKAVEVVVENPA